MFIFQLRKEVQDPIKKLRISNEAKKLLRELLSGKRKELWFYFGTKEAAVNFVVAMESLQDYFIKKYGIKVSVPAINEIEKTEGGWEVYMKRTIQKPEEAAAIPQKLLPTVSYQLRPERLPPGAIPSEEEAEKKLEEAIKNLEAQGYTVEILTPDKVEEWKTTHKDDETSLLGPFVFVRKVDDSKECKIFIEDFATSPEAEKYYLKDETNLTDELIDIFHKFGYYLSNTETYGVTDPLEIRNKLGTPVGLAAAVYSSWVNFATGHKTKAKNKSAIDLAAYMLRGYTGVITDKTKPTKVNELKTIEMHRKNIDKLMKYDAVGGSFEKLREFIPNDLWVAIYAYSNILADKLISEGIVKKEKRNEYLNVFAFGFLAQMFFEFGWAGESGLDLNPFFAWLREETDMSLNPDNIIKNIMGTPDKYRLFYGDQEITETTIVKASPYKDLMIKDAEGNPLAHLRISHPHWLDNKKAWDVDKDKTKWSWLGIGLTSKYHQYVTQVEITSNLIPGVTEELFIGGFKPKGKEEPLKVEANAFGITGDKEFRLNQTRFVTHGRIWAYGEKTIYDLKNDPNFFLEYIGIAVPKGFSEKKGGVVYLLLPEGGGLDLKNRLPYNISDYEKRLQNVALVYEDYRYDLVLTIDGKRINILPGISKYLIDEGLTKDDLLYEINPNNTLDIFVCRNENGKLIKKPAEFTGKKYVEVLAQGVNLSDKELKAIREKGISPFVSFEDNGRTGLDIYSVVKIEKDGKTILVDAANIAGHEFNNEWLYAKGYRKQYICSLPSSRVVETATGKSYHILPTDIPEQYKNLLVGVIPRELIEVSDDGKSGKFTARLDNNVRVQGGIERYFVNYYLNYEGKPPLSYEFSSLPVSVETLTHKDAATRKKAIAQLLSLSQSPLSPEEASNYMGLISQVEAKWKDKLDKEDRRNLAAARANFENYSNMAGKMAAGKMAAGVSERPQTEIGVPVPPVATKEMEYPPPQSIIPTDLLIGLDPEEINKAFLNLWEALFRYSYLGYEGKSESERSEAAKKYMKEFMKIIGLPTSRGYANLNPEQKEAVKSKLFADPNVSDDVTIALLRILESGNIDNLINFLKNYEQSPMAGALRGMSNVTIYIPKEMVTVGVGGTVFTFKSEGYKAGELGAPQGGLAINMCAFLDLIKESYEQGNLEINFENGTFAFKKEYLTRYGAEPRAQAEVVRRLAGGEELYLKGAIGLRFIFDDQGRLKTTYGTPQLTAGIGGMKFGNVVVGIEGDYTKLPVFQGTVDSYTLTGKADFILLHIPWEVKVGGRMTAGEGTVFAVFGGKIVQSEDGEFYITPFIGAEGSTEELKKFFGVTIGAGPMQTQLSVSQSPSNNLLVNFGLRLGF